MFKLRTHSAPGATDSREHGENPLAREFQPDSLLKFAFPSMVMMILMGFYTITDTIFVARFVNPYALSALNIVCPVINLIVGLGSMIASGGSAVVARNMGCGRERQARQNFTMLIIVGAILGGLICLLGVVFLDDIIRGLGSGHLLYPYCRDYLLLLLLFTPASILQVLFQNFFVTAGRPGLGMILAAAAGAANILLDYLFLVPLHMGIAGSALGTGIGYLIPAVIGGIFFLRTKGALRFEKPAADWNMLAASCLNGSSEMVGQLAAAVTTFLFNQALMGLAGEDGVAAVTILIYSQFLLSTLFIGYSMGVAPVISYHFGGKNYLQLKRIFHICFGFIGIVSLLTFSGTFLGAPRLVSLFAPEESTVYRLAVEGFRIFSFSFLFCGWNLFTSAAFTALSNGKVSAVLSFLRTFGFLSVALLLLPRLFGLTGVWLATPLAEGAALILSVRSLLRYRNVYRYL